MTVAGNGQTTPGCAACNSLVGEPASAPPHGALVLTGERSSSYGIAGTDTGADYRCDACGRYLYRHTGRLDERTWSWAESPEEQAARRAMPVHYTLAEARDVLGPLGFDLDEGALPWGSFPRAWRCLAATAYHPGAVGRDPHERPIYLSVHFPSGPLEDCAIRVGVSGSAAGGRFSGPPFVLRDLHHLRGASANLVPYLETNIGRYLCPVCRGFKVDRTRRRDRHPFAGCEHYGNPNRDCRWTGTSEVERPWPG